MRLAEALIIGKLGKSIPMRKLTTDTRLRLEEIIERLGTGQPVSLEERIQLNKYSLHIPFIAGKVAQAHRRREAFNSL